MSILEAELKSVHVNIFLEVCLDINDHIVDNLHILIYLYILYVYKMHCSVL